MKSYAKIRRIRFSQNKLPNGTVDITCLTDVDTPEGTQVVRTETDVRPGEDLTTIIRVLTDQIELAIREAREL